MPLHIGPCNGDPAVTCGRLKRPEGSRERVHIPPNGKFGKSSTQNVPNGWGDGLVPWKVRVILFLLQNSDSDDKSYRIMPP